MNRERMIEIAKHALWDQQNPIDEWDEAEPAERVIAHHDAAAVIDALVAAGCVPSDELTQAARHAASFVRHTHGGHPYFDLAEQRNVYEALDALRAAVTPDEQTED